MHLHLYLETIHEWIRGGLLSELSYLYLGNELVGFVYNGDKYYY